jgi:competence protein ComEC
MREASKTSNLFSKKFWLRAIHQSWVITIFCLSFLVGVGLAYGPAFNLFTNPWWLLLAIIFFVISLVKPRISLCALAIIAGVLFGLWRGANQHVAVAAYHDLIGKTVKISGNVSEDPEFEGGAVKLKLNQIQINGSALAGSIYATATGATDIKRSDRVEISGKLKAGFGTFAASFSYATITKVTRTAGEDPARDIRDAFGDRLRKVIPAPASDLGMGILAGQKTALPADVSAAFIAASLTHIVVASGYNLTILIRFSRRLFAKISRLAALLGAGGLVFAFALVTGFSPSMTRASLVAGLSLLAWYYGRKFHPIVLLLLVAAITVALNPNYLWGDAGWWMSFLSFAGVLMLAPLIKSYFWGSQPDMRKRPTFTKLLAEKLLRKKPDDKDFGERKHSLRQVFIETLSAQMMAAPVIALFLGQFSPYGLLANIVVLPIVPLAMLLTFVAGIGAFILPIELGKIVAWPAEKLLNYIIDVAKWTADLPGASQTVSFSVWSTIGVFVIMSGILLYLKWRTKHNFREDNVIE